MAAPAADHRPGGDACLAGLRAGVPRNHYFDRVDPEVAAAFWRLEALGARLVEIDVPMTCYVQAAQWGLMMPTLMRREWARLFQEVNVIAAPAVPVTALDAVSDAYVRLSSPADITGFPALSLPVGHDAAGMPIGIQLLGGSGRAW
ncbi:amidase family protein [Actinomadura macrotermitis]|uniref:Glutamyl-tRNA(Gln) amidotransferase subunit A n=1 Tax=Actinomadura macrotermitis TaxID=2585200 RepID=A0A7K0BTS7_9ACTN|nr:amidase family protein [Actinomadura macrotermitis]MQY04547.1 Glutamyl-tRNA(Gln) amidotransferase subunit A [Actinomadura macrotermitis]